MNRVVDWLLVLTELVGAGVERTPAYPSRGPILILAGGYGISVRINEVNPSALGSDLCRVCPGPVCRDVLASAVLLLGLLIFVHSELMHPATSNALPVIPLQCCSLRLSYGCPRNIQISLLSALGPWPTHGYSPA